jgi:transcriptional regulator with XRE-family HTH domain
MTKIRELHTGWMQDESYKREYDALEDEFSLAQSLIEARLEAGLTQDQLATRMETSQSAIARLESGRALPSARTLSRYAKATGTMLKVSFEKPAQSARS